MEDRRYYEGSGDGQRSSKVAAMHDWLEDQGAVSHNHRSAPWWKCSKCGVRAQTWDKPSGDMVVVAKALGFQSGADVSFAMSCDEYLTLQVMEA